LFTSGSCDRASLTQEKKEPTDDTSIDVYSQYVNSTCFGHLHSHSVFSSCPDSTQPQPAHPG